MFAVRNLSFAYATAPILSGASLTVDDGERVALVGKNGAGKSTLLAILMGTIKADDGVVETGRGQRIGVLAQNPTMQMSGTVMEVAKGALGEVSALLAEMEITSHELPRYNEILSRIDDLSGFDIDHRIETVLSRLSLDKDADASSLSGGQRRRLDLACLLLASPEILLLDEPTNHVDADGIAFLRDEMKKHPGPIIFISHDRGFLDEAATRIVDLEQGVLLSYPPPKDKLTSVTDAYLEAKLIRDEVRENTLHKRKQLWIRELAWLRAGTPARTTKQQARIGRAEELNDEVAKQSGLLRERQREAQMAGSAAVRVGKEAIVCKDLSLARGDRVLVEAGGQGWAVSIEAEAERDSDGNRIALKSAAGRRFTGRIEEGGKIVLSR